MAVKSVPSYLEPLCPFNPGEPKSPGTGMTTVLEIYNRGEQDPQFQLIFGHFDQAGLASAFRALAMNMIDDPVDLTSESKTLIGQRIQDALHHVPPSPPKQRKWCCIVF